MKQQTENKKYSIWILIYNLCDIFFFMYIIVCFYILITLPLCIALYVFVYIFSIIYCFLSFIGKVSNFLKIIFMTYLYLLKLISGLLFMVVFNDLKCSVNSKSLSSREFIVIITYFAKSVNFYQITRISANQFMNLWWNHAHKFKIWNETEI